MFVSVSCNFKATSAKRRQLSGELTSRVYLERVLCSSAASLGELCNTEVKRNSQQTCIKISEVNRTNN